MLYHGYFGSWGGLVGQRKGKIKKLKRLEIWHCFLFGFFQHLWWFVVSASAMTMMMGQIQTVVLLLWWASCLKIQSLRSWLFGVDSLVWCQIFGLELSLVGIGIGMQHNPQCFCDCLYDMGYMGWSIELSHPYDMTKNFGFLRLATFESEYAIICEQNQCLSENSKFHVYIININITVVTNPISINMIMIV